MCVMHGSTVELGAMIALVFAPSRHRSMISVTIIEVMVYMAIKVLMPMKPRSGADEHSTFIPFRTVVAIGSAAIRRHLVIPIRARRLLPNTHGNLRWSLGTAS